MKNEGVREKWKRGKVKGGNGIKKRSKTPLFGIICLFFFYRGVYVGWGKFNLKGVGGGEVIKMHNIYP